MVSKLDREDLEGEGAVPEYSTPQWYILKCQVNREDRCKKELDRRIKIAGLEDQISEVIVPTEVVQEFDKNGKLRNHNRKLYPGYVMVKMILNEATWFLMRETPGVGDFAGTSGKPMPMRQSDVDEILNRSSKEEVEKPKMQIPFEIGEVVKIVDGGSFHNLEGEVISADSETGAITVSVKMFGNNVPFNLELEYWQAEKVSVEN